MKEIIIKYWIELLLTGIVSMVSWQAKRAVKKIQQEVAEQKNIKMAVLSILRDRLYTECTRILEKGSINVREIDNLSCMYVAYHDGLGGNGTIEELYKRCLTLPTAK